MLNKRSGVRPIKFAVFHFAKDDVCGIILLENLY